MYLLITRGIRLRGQMAGKRGLCHSRARTDVRVRRDRIPKALGTLDVTLLCHWPVLGGARRAYWYHSNALARTRVYAWLRPTWQSEQNGGRPPTRATIPSSARPVQRHLKFWRSEIAAYRIYARWRKYTRNPWGSVKGECHAELTSLISLAGSKKEKEKIKIERESVMQRMRVRGDVMLRRFEYNFELPISDVDGYIVPVFQK